MANRVLMRVNWSNVVTATGRFTALIFCIYGLFSFSFDLTHILQNVGTENRNRIERTFQALEQRSMGTEATPEFRRELFERGKEVVILSLASEDFLSKHIITKCLVTFCVALFSVCVAIFIYGKQGIIDYFFIRSYVNELRDAWGTGLMILWCFLAYVCPLFGWILGGINMSKTHNAEGRRKQALVLVIISSVSFILSIVFMMFFMYIGVLAWK